MSAERRAAGAPWTERLYDALPLAPAWVGVVAALGLVALFFLSRAVFSSLGVFREPDVFLLRDVRLGVINALTLAYLPTAWVYSMRTARRTWQALRPLLDLDDAAFAQRLAEVGRYAPGRLRLAGWVGVVLGALIPLSVEPGAEIAYRVSYWSAELPFHRVGTPLAGWWVLRLGYALVAESVRLSRLAARVRSIDLLDLGALTPFTRQGLANSFWALGFISILSLLLLEVGFGATVARLGLLSVAIAAVALVLPLGGIHRRIRAARADELARVRAALRGRRGALADSALAPHAEAVAVADLIAYEGRIERVTTWPFDASTLLRFAAYLLIPLASWSGGALVERAIDALLD